MNDILLFTAVGIALYLASDWAVRAIEQRRGSPLGQRQVVFFLIFLVLALVSFQILQRVLSSTGM